MADQQFDAIIVGAGFSGMYMLHLLRQQGRKVKVIERGSGVGGTWYWNRYPGCRCDVESMEYSYEFDEDLQQEWTWTERYSPQPEILSYANHVADRYQLRNDIQFDTTVTSATYDEDQKSWAVGTDQGDFICRFLIMATGCLSATNIPDFDGLEDYKGDTYHTGSWPHDGVDFSGKKVAVIGTGSSGIQSIPIIAEQADHLTVFQRTPNYSVPAANHKLDPVYIETMKMNYGLFRRRNQLETAAFGSNLPRRMDSILLADEDKRQYRLNEYWEMGGFGFLGAFADIGMIPEANELAAEFVRGKIREIVKDPETAELLCPDNRIGCKRLCADTGYFETYNRDNVDLVSVKDTPIERLTETGLVVGDTSYDFDAIVFATGFDAMTGALTRCNISGKGGQPLTDKWAEGPKTYLGLMTEGFPNLFMMTGPGSPSVLSNMIKSAEQHAQFIAGFIDWTQAEDKAVVEADKAAEEAWIGEVNERASLTLYPSCNSWYLGANVPGKPRVFMPYIGYPDYADKLKDVSANGYAGFNCA